MRRNLALVGGVLLVIAVLIGGVTLFSDQPAPTSPNESDARPDPSDLAPNTSTPRSPTPTATPAPPVFAPNDPGQSTYPRQPTSESGIILYSRDIADHLGTQINSYREQEGLAPLREPTTLRSVTRAHSLDMAARGYFDERGPESPPLVEQYNGTATECSNVERVVLRRNETVMTAQNTSVHTTSEGFAAEFFATMLDDDRMRSLVLTEDADVFGLGAFVFTQERPDGSVVATVYLTTDYCTTEN